MQALTFIVLTSAILCLMSAKNSYYDTTIIIEDSIYFIQQTQPQHTAPLATPIEGDDSLTYECTLTTVIITGKNATNYGSIFAVGTNANKSKEECKVSRTVQNRSVQFEISGCEVTKPITIITMQERQNWNQRDMVIGGQLTAEYELQCNDIYLGGVTMTRTFNLSKVQDLIVNQSHHQPDFTLKMEIQDTDHKTINNTVLIGTDLLLVITGTHGFRLYIQSCVARSFPNINAHSKPLIVNGAANDPFILTNFSNQKSKGDNTSDIIEAHLYAFHFMDSATISVECTVSVCQNDDNSCPAFSSSIISTPAHTSVKTNPSATYTTSTQKPTTATKTSTASTSTVRNATATTITTSALSGRRKRNAANLVPLKHTVRTILRVVDNNDVFKNTPDSSSVSRVSTLSMVPVFLCIALQVFTLQM